MNGNLIIFFLIFFFILLYILAKSRSLIFFGSVFSMILTLGSLYIFTFIKGFQNRILKVLIFIFYVISAVLFSNIEPNNRYIKGLNNSFMSYYLWSLGFISVITSCIYPNKYNEAKKNFYIRFGVAFNLLVFFVFFVFALSEYISAKYSKTKLFCIADDSNKTNFEKKYCFLLETVLGEEFNRIDESKDSLLSNVFGTKKDNVSNGQLIILLIIFIVILGGIASNIEVVIDRIKMDRFSYVNLIYLIILYIPCLFLDIIRFLNKEFKIAKNETILLFVILLILCILYFIYPLIYKKLAYKDSILLLNKPKYLDFVTELGNTSDLKKPSFSLFRKSYEKKDIYSKKTIETKKKLEMIDDEITQLALDISLAEIRNEEIEELISSNKYRKYKEYTPQSEIMDMSEQLELLEEEKLDLDTSYNELVTYDISGDTIKYIEDDETNLSYIGDGKDKPRIRPSEDNNYNYTLSFWLYINPTQTNAKESWTNILNFGEKIKVNYNIVGSNQNMLEFKIKDNKGNDKVLHVESMIPSQKWHNIIIINSDSIIDVFLNASLRSSTDNIILDTKNSNITIGNDNGVTGSICNFFYYYGVLNMDKIKENYGKLKNKDPPII